MHALKSVLVFRNGAIAAFDESSNQIHGIQAFNISDLIIEKAKELGIPLMPEIRITLPGPCEVVRKYRNEEQDESRTKCKTTKKKPRNSKTHT